jgi:GNAT superfamily N-acetyltransferase
MAHIRLGCRADAPVLADFQRRLARETEGLELDPATLRQGVDAVFDDISRGRYWVVEQGGELLACALVLTEWSDWRNGEVWWIHSLYVVPEARRQGHFKALYAHLLRQVEASPQLKGLRLYVAKGNQAARRAYEAMGMSDEHYILYEWMKS